MVRVQPMRLRRYTASLHGEVGSGAPPVHHHTAAGFFRVWCGVVWCGVVWCGVVRFGVPKALLPKGNIRDGLAHR